MKTNVQALNQLVRESRYRVDERAIADAILSRARIQLRTRFEAERRLRGASAHHAADGDR